jgi:hypothetical protein
LTFQFTPASGSTLNLTSETVSVAAASQVYFQSAVSESLGGEFTVTIPFTLGSSTTVASGTDLTKSISSVSVTAANTIGTSNSLQVVLP